MILVTGAMGRIGTATVAALRERGIPTRALVPARRRVPWLTDLAPDLQEGDYDDGRCLARALDGVQAVVLIARPFADQVAAQERVVDACAQAGITRVVKLSVAGADEHAPAEAARLHWHAEQHLLASGLDACVARAGRTMQDLQFQAPLILWHHQLVGCQGDGVAPDVDARDVGAVLAGLALADTVPTDPVLVTGPEALTRHAMAETLGRAFGLPLRYVHCSPTDLETTLLAAGVNLWQVEDLVAYERAARDGHRAVITDAVPRWAGTPARTFATFANEFGTSLRYAHLPSAPSLSTQGSRAA